LEKEVNRIKFNDKFWFFIQGNKVVFGESGNVDGDHYTISFGNRTGYFDVHLKSKYLTKEEGFTILTWSRENFYSILPQLFKKILNTVFEGQEVNEEQLNQCTLYQIQPLDNLEGEVKTLNKKIKGKLTLLINAESDEFKDMVNNLFMQFNFEKVTLDELNNSSDFMGIVENTDSIKIIMKSSYIGSNIMTVKNLNLDINLIFRKILGDEVYNQILLNIEKGIEYLKQIKAERGGTI
jgi:hypothetical protein